MPTKEEHLNCYREDAYGALADLMDLLPSCPECGNPGFAVTLDRKADLVKAHCTNCGKELAYMDDEQQLLMFDYPDKDIDITTEGMNRLKEELEKPSLEGTFRKLVEMRKDLFASYEKAKTDVVRTLFNNGITDANNILEALDTLYPPRRATIATLDRTACAHKDTGLEDISSRLADAFVEDFMPGMADVDKQRLLGVFFNVAKDSGFDPGLAAEPAERQQPGAAWAKEQPSDDKDDAESDSMDRVIGHLMDAALAANSTYRTVIDAAVECVRLFTVAVCGTEPDREAILASLRGVVKFHVGEAKRGAYKETDND